jgi:hypothetical protein
MTKLKDLYNDPRFPAVSASTKTDIMGAIGINVNDAKSDIPKGNYSKQELVQALRHLLEAEVKKKNPRAASLMVREQPSSSTSIMLIDSPFYVRRADPLFQLLDIAVHYNHHSHSSHSSSSSSGNSDGAAGAILVGAAIACVCLSAVCCGGCMAMTVSNNTESTRVKAAKVTGSTAVGLATFVGLSCYFLLNNVLHSDIVEDRNLSESTYQFLMVLLAAASGLLASGTVSTVNNIWRCPTTDDTSEPSPRVLAALAELDMVKTLLTQGWSRAGDNEAQCSAFVREVIIAYIDEIAQEPELQQVQVIVEKPVVNTSFNLFKPSAPPAGYIELSGGDQPEVKKPEPSAPPQEDDTSSERRGFRRFG